MSSIPLAEAGTIAPEDVDKGKLFDVPRIGIEIDESEPSVVKLAFAGGVELDRSNRQQIELYNRLKAGSENEIVVTLHVAGAKKTHRRDSEGYVDAIVETKSLIVTDVYFAEVNE
jgi:hypothetical protein